MRSRASAGRTPLSVAIGRPPSDCQISSEMRNPTSTETSTVISDGVRSSTGSVLGPAGAIAGPQRHRGWGCTGGVPERRPGSATQATSPSVRPRVSE